MFSKQNVVPRRSSLIWSVQASIQYCDLIWLHVNALRRVDIQIFFPNTVVGCSIIIILVKCRAIIKKQIDLNWINVREQFVSLLIVNSIGLSRFHAAIRALDRFDITIYFASLIGNTLLVPITFLFRKSALHCCPCLLFV